MTKKICALWLLIGFLSVIGAETEQTYTSGHYTFTLPETYTGIEETADALNALWDEFNGYFRFDPTATEGLNRVVILPDKAAFDAYLKDLIGETRNQYVFLKYGQRELSELVLYPQADNSGYKAFEGPSLNRQLFLQFIYSYINEPPLWIRDGFQAYFETISFDTATHAINRGNEIPWLETAKLSEADPVRKINAGEILSAVTGSFEAVRFYPQSWAFVTFLVNSEKEEYQRFLHEAFMLLEDNTNYNVRSQQENTDAVLDRFIRFNSAKQASADFSLWLSNQHTFNELIQSGVASYNAGNYVIAYNDLMDAIKLRSNDPLANYYLGLVTYAQKDYKNAELWYRKSLEYGGEISTIHWALALNSYADKRYAEARVFLETAKNANPARYASKATDLINSMPK